VKRLLLLRHAKAMPALASEDDAERLLTAGGREDAGRLGRFLKASGYACELVLCSTARRTRDTLEAVLSQCRSRPRVRFLKELYLADTKTIRAAVAGVNDVVDVLMIVGHNPGLETYARMLTGSSPSFPACAAAVVDFSTDRWSEAAAGRGQLERFVRAGDLPPG
jgi:phosphohistidine phosphatase